jgi:3-oxoacyl-[acyl-carrier-protein] synthase I
VRRLACLSHWEAITSLGECAAETALLLRAGLNNVAPSLFVDAAGERVLFCAAPALPSNLPAADRLIALGAHALTGLFLALERGCSPTRQRFAPIVLMALPERFAAGASSAELNEAGRAFLNELRRALPNEWAGADIEAFPFGRAAGALALSRALRCLNNDRLVIWGGVDTLHDWAVLQALEAADRLVTVENIDGVRPGEAAAFAVITDAVGEGEVGLLGLGLGREPFPVGSEQPSFAIGLTQALDAAVAPLRAARLRTNEWWLDLTHEDYATQALQNIIARFGDVLGLKTELQMPLKELGDVGAAAMPLLAVLGAEAWRLGHAIDRTAIVTGCSDNGARGALLMTAPDSFVVEAVTP